MAQPVAHIQTLKVHAGVTDNAMVGLVEKNNIIVVEDRRKLAQAVAEGHKQIVLTTAAALAVIAWQKNLRNLSICCFIIAFILAISFGIAMGEWKSSSNAWETSANSLQTSVSQLRDELQSDIFYTDYDTLVDTCLSNEYSVCYDIGIRLTVDNPSYSDRFGVILSLPKNPTNEDECLTSFDHKCTVRHYTYSSKASNNCRASDHEINSDCESIITDSYDSCTSLEMFSVSNGGSYYRASDSCDVENVLEQLTNGYEVSCNDCAVVIKLEDVIQHSQNLF